ncbi:MAG: tyrosine-protein phosphatase [Acidobacteria bacterium]|nr:tyrosine-protein phosphatase [Acidobacteriota bacterium]
MRARVLRIALIAAVIGLAAAGLTPAQKASDRELPNFGKVNDNLYRGGQPTAEGFQALAKMGVRTVVNLRNADDRAKREEALARAAGLKYLNIPLNNWFGPKDATIAEIEKTLDAPENQPVFVHCKRGADRTGVVVAVYRIRRDGWTGDEANAEAKKYDFGWWQIWMKDFIDDYYRDHKK